MADPICPVGCTAELPPVQFDVCNPQICDAQISRIFMTNKDNPLTDVTDVAEWNLRLDDSGTAADAIRTLHVIGSKGKPSANIKDISLKRKVIGQKDHQIDFVIDECNAVNHEMVRLLECGGNYLFWYETCGGQIFGGNEGIEGFIELDMVIAESADEIVTYEGTITWKSKFTEEVAVSPL